MNYPNSGSVSAYGPGLVYGVANKTATFTIVTEDAGEGTLWFTWAVRFRPAVWAVEWAQFQSSFYK